jgi:hypothetical protein
MQYIYWKWSKKDNVVKSKRGIIENNAETTATDNESQSTGSNTSMDVIKTPHINDSKSKREECCERMSNRKWVIQRNINPYLTNNNYINDLNTQSKYLIPKDSNIEKIDTNVSLS